MQLVIIRHALPRRVDGGSGTPADPELSDAGHAQAQHLADYLAGEGVAAVYSSPQRRAIQTAEPLTRLLELPAVVVDGVAEYDVHSDRYIPVEEMRNDPSLVESLADYSPDERTAFRQRVLDSMGAIAAAHPGEKVAVVCHGGVINAYLIDVLDLRDKDTAGFFLPGYTSVHRVLVGRAGRRTVIAINEVAHLRGTGLPVGVHG